MRSNEIAVSLETELLIHWRCPGLKAKAFQHPIWHDELTFPLRPDLRDRLVRQRLSRQHGTSDDDRHERDLLAACPTMLVHDWSMSPTDDGLDGVGLWDLRRAITRWPHRERPTEAMMERYESQAAPFYHAWSERWGTVEDERLRFENLCEAGDWRQAVRERETYWTKVADANGVPYGDEAQTLFKLGF